MPDNFVRRNGTQFALAGQPFPVVGVNCYFLGYCAQPSRLAAMETAKEMGANVIRTWAFFDTADGSQGGFQYQIGRAHV